MKMRKPTVALVGRPNVGKSTLFNRLVGKRTAIVEDLPGTTRDRIYGESDWNGVGFNVIDTGGLEAPSSLGATRRPPGSLPLAIDSAPFIEHIQNQAQLAIQEADAILFVVDGMEGLTSADQEIADILRISSKPLLLVVNKTESQERQMNALEFWKLGLGEPYPISAYHGDGTGDLLDILVKALPAWPVDEEKEDSVGITIVGRPNVGKSSLLNTLLGAERAIVSPVPGTTRDPIDTELTFNGQKLILIDTAGIRRRGSIEPGIEQYSVLRGMRSIDRADVVLLVIDALEGVTAQDTHVAGYVLEKTKSVVVLINKWDALEKDSQTIVEYTRRVREELKFMDYVPVLFISALTKQRVHLILPTALEVVKTRKERIGTSAFNHLLREAYDATPPQSMNGRRLRIYYGTQISNDPPSFALFVNDPELAHFSYQRYLENQIRLRFPYTGTPIHILFRQSKSNRDN